MIVLRAELEAVRPWAQRDRISIRVVDVPAFDADALASALVPYGTSRWTALLLSQSIIPWFALLWSGWWRMELRL